MRLVWVLFSPLCNKRPSLQFEAVRPSPDRGANSAAVSGECRGARERPLAWRILKESCVVSAGAEGAAAPPPKKENNKESKGCFIAQAQQSRVPRTPPRGPPGPPPLPKGGAAPEGSGRRPRSPQPRERGRRSHGEQERKQRGTRGSAPSEQNGKAHAGGPSCLSRCGGVEVCDLRIF